MKINGQPVIDAKQNLKLPITAGDIKLGHPKSPSSCAAGSEIIAVDRGGSFSPGLYTLARITPSKLNTGKRKGTAGNASAAKKKTAKKRSYHVISGVRQHGANR